MKTSINLTFVKKQSILTKLYNKVFNKLISRNLFKPEIFSTKAVNVLLVNYRELFSMKKSFMKNSKEGEVYTGSLLQQKRYFAVGK